jgi:hypothetical protein
MPVTAKLSRKFYERLGEDVANELVDWFNAVDATYRNDLREINELNFQRFDAKVEQRFAQFRVEIDGRFAEADVRFAQARVEIERRLAELRMDLREEIAGVRNQLADTRAELLKWMFGFWVATLVPLAGLILFNIQ